MKDIGTEITVQIFKERFDVDVCYIILSCTVEGKNARRRRLFLMLIMLIDRRSLNSIGFCILGRDMIFEFLRKNETLFPNNNNVATHLNKST